MVEEATEAVQTETGTVAQTRAQVATNTILEATKVQVKMSLVTKVQETITMAGAHLTTRAGTMTLILDGVITPTPILIVTGVTTISLMVGVTQLKVMVMDGVHPIRVPIHGLIQETKMDEITRRAHQLVGMINKGVLKAGVVAQVTPMDGEITQENQKDGVRLVPKLKVGITQEAMTGGIAQVTTKDGEIWVITQIMMAVGTVLLPMMEDGRKEVALEIRIEEVSLSLLSHY